MNLSQEVIFHEFIKKAKKRNLSWRKNCPKTKIIFESFQEIGNRLGYDTYHAKKRGMIFGSMWQIYVGGSAEFQRGMIIEV